jgi:formylglycine-generating enzyme required for sulfatase activity
MIGNVEEMTTSIIEDGERKFMVARGGHYTQVPVFCTVFSRAKFPLDGRSPATGFRVIAVPKIK